MKNVGLRCVIVENHANRNNTNKVIRDHFPEIAVLAATHCHDAAIEKISEFRPDLVFVEVQDAYASAIQAIRRFYQLPCQVILTSGNQHYEAPMDLPSLHFLPGPVTPEKIERLLHRIERNLLFQILREQAQGYPTLKKQEKLAYTNNHYTELIDLNMLTHLSASGSYTCLHLADGTQRLSSKFLGHYEKSLNKDQFCRVHRKFLINVDHVVKFDKAKTLTVYLSSGVQIQASSSSKDKLLELIKYRTAF